MLTIGTPTDNPEQSDTAMLRTFMDKHLCLPALQNDKTDRETSVPVFYQHQCSILSVDTSEQTIEQNIVMLMGSPPVPQFMLFI